MSRPTIELGECFQRVSKPPTKWWVERILEYPDLPLHARLVRTDFDPTTITVALSVLLDKRFFIRQPGEPQ